VREYLGGLPDRFPLPPGVSELADQFAFLVSTLSTGSPAARNSTAAALTYSNWASRSGVLTAFEDLGVGLQPVPARLEQLGYRPRPHRKPLPGQLVGQLLRGLVRPPQRRLRRRC
jgi:hypothetical protein